MDFPVGGQAVPFTRHNLQQEPSGTRPPVGRPRALESGVRFFVPVLSSRLRRSAKARPIGAAFSYITPPLRGSRQIEGAARGFSGGGTGCSLHARSAVLPDKGGNPDKPNRCSSEKAMHGRCNPFATALQRRFMSVSEIFFGGFSTCHNTRLPACDLSACQAGVQAGEACPCMVSAGGAPIRKSFMNMLSLESQVCT